MIALPNELMLMLAVIGIFALCSCLLWAAPQLWYRAKHKRYKPSYEELELQHVKQLQELTVEHLNADLKAEREKSEGLATQLQDTIDKLVSKI